MRNNFLNRNTIRTMLLSSLLNTVPYMPAKAETLPLERYSLLEATSGKETSYLPLSLREPETWPIHPLVKGSDLGDLVMMFPSKPQKPYYLKQGESFEERQQSYPSNEEAGNYSPKAETDSNKTLEKTLGWVLIGGGAALATALLVWVNTPCDPNQLPGASSCDRRLSTGGWTAVTLSLGAVGGGIYLVARD